MESKSHRVARTHDPKHAVQAVAGGANLPLPIAGMGARLPRLGCGLPASAPLAAGPEGLGWVGGDGRREAGSLRPRHSPAVLAVAFGGVG